MTITNEQLRLAAYLSQGLNPAAGTPVDHGPLDYGDLPVPGEGADVSGAIKAMVRVRLRADPRWRRSIFWVSTHVAGETYTVTLDGTPFATVVSGVTEAEALQECADTINADPDWAASVDTMEIPGVGSVDVLIVRPTGDDTNYTIGLSATGGAVLASTQEAAEVDFELWAIQRGASQINAWDRVNGGAIAGLEYNWIERVDVAGLDRLCVRFVATDGLVSAQISPCLESA